MEHKESIQDRSPTIVARETAKYKLGLVGVQEARWDWDGTEPAGDYTLSYGMGMRITDLGQDFSCIRESS
jgi:hypothetical protein